jgi:hypothetical protein
MEFFTDDERTDTDRRDGTDARHASVGSDLPRRMAAHAAPTLAMWHIRGLAGGTGP